MGFGNYITTILLIDLGNRVPYSHQAVTFALNANSFGPEKTTGTILVLYLAFPF